MENAHKLIDFVAVRINPISNRKVLEKIKESFDYFRPTLIIALDPDGNSSRTGYRIGKLIKRITLFAEEEIPVLHFSHDQNRMYLSNLDLL